MSHLFEWTIMALQLYLTFPRDSNSPRQKSLRLNNNRKKKIDQNPKK